MKFRPHLIVCFAFDCHESKKLTTSAEIVEYILPSSSVELEVEVVPMMIKALSSSQINM